MESNINQGAIDAYSNRLTKHVCDQFFSGKAFIKGEEIVRLTPVQQINYFVLKELFHRWKAEVQRLKSPYFNYDHDEVQSELSKFVAILSNHILIQRDDFEPLLKQATIDAITIIFSPYEFFLKEINSPRFNRLSLSDLHDLRKYIKVNQHLLLAYIRKFEEEGIEAVFNDDAVRMFNEVIESTTEIPEEFDVFLKQFSEVIPLSDETVFGDGDIGSDQVEDKDKEEEVQDINKEPPRNEPVSEQQGTLLDAFEEQQKDAPAEMHPKQPSGGIRKSITLNQRFMFVNDLFKGSMDDFEQAIVAIEGKSSLEEAMQYIEEQFINNNRWDPEKEEVQEFIEVVQRKFPR